MPRILVPCVFCAIFLSRSNCLLARIMFDIRPVAVREWNDEAATQKPDTGQFKFNYARIKLYASIDIWALPLKVWVRESFSRAHLAFFTSPLVPWIWNKLRLKAMHRTSSIFE